MEPDNLMEQATVTEPVSVRCMLRRAFEADTAEQPNRVTYVAALQWPDGDMKQGHFALDKERYESMKEEQGDKCPTWEHIVLNMSAQLIEKILTQRKNEVSKLIVLPPTRGGMRH